MILKTRSNVYMHQLSFIAWFILLCLPMFGKLSVGSDNWLLLCTQKGVQLTNVSLTLDQSNLHKSESCACSSETYVDQIDHHQTFIPRSVNPSIAQYSFQIAKFNYLLSHPRAPPFLISASQST